MARKYVNSLLLIGVFLLVINHHTTFFINSLAHIFENDYRTVFAGASLIQQNG